MAKHRDRPLISITLSHGAIAAADELAVARGMSRSALIEHLIREESFRFRLDVRDLGRRERRKRRARR